MIHYLLLLRPVTFQYNSSHDYSAYSSSSSCYQKSSHSNTYYNSTQTQSKPQYCCGPSCRSCIAKTSPPPVSSSSASSSTASLLSTSTSGVSRVAKKPQEQQKKKQTRSTSDLSSSSRPGPAPPSTKPHYQHQRHQKQQKQQWQQQSHVRLERKKRSERDCVNGDNNKKEGIRGSVLLLSSKSDPRKENKPGKGKASAVPASASGSGRGGSNLWKWSQRRDRSGKTALPICNSPSSVDDHDRDRDRAGGFCKYQQGKSLDQAEGSRSKETSGGEEGEEAAAAALNSTDPTRVNFKRASRLGLVKSVKIRFQRGRFSASSSSFPSKVHPRRFFRSLRKLHFPFTTSRRSCGGAGAKEEKQFLGEQVPTSDDYYDCVAENDNEDQRKGGKSLRVTCVVGSGFGDDTRKKVVSGYFSGRKSSRNNNNNHNNNKLRTARVGCSSSTTASTNLKKVETTTIISSSKVGRETETRRIITRGGKELSFVDQFLESEGSSASTAAALGKLGKLKLDENKRGREEEVAAEDRSDSGEIIRNNNNERGTATTTTKKSGKNFEKFKKFLFFCKGLRRKKSK